MINQAVPYLFLYALLVIEKYTDSMYFFCSLLFSNRKWIFVDCNPEPRCGVNALYPFGCSSPLGLVLKRKFDSMFHIVHTMGKDCIYIPFPLSLFLMISEEKLQITQKLLNKVFWASLNSDSKHFCSLYSEYLLTVEQAWFQPYSITL